MVSKQIKKEDEEKKRATSQMVNVILTLKN